MVERKEYLDQLWAWKDERQIKVVTGIRRCGKSVLLEQYQQRLLANGVAPEQIISMLLNKSGKCLAGQGVAPTVYRQFAQYPQNSKPAFLHYALVCMPKAHHICSCVRSPYRFLKFNAATKQPNAPFTLQHIRSAFSHKNL